MPIKGRKLAEISNWAPVKRNTTYKLHFNVMDAVENGGLWQTHLYIPYLKRPVPLWLRLTGRLGRWAQSCLISVP